MVHDTTRTRIYLVFLHALIFGNPYFFRSRCKPKPINNNSPSESKGANILSSQEDLKLSL